MLPGRCNFSTPATVNVAKNFTELKRDDGFEALAEHPLYLRRRGDERRREGRRGKERKLKERKGKETK